MFICNMRSDKKNNVNKLCCDFNHWAKNTNVCAIKKYKIDFYMNSSYPVIFRASDSGWVILIHGNFLVTCGIERLDN